MLKKKEEEEKEKLPNPRPKDLLLFFLLGSFIALVTFRSVIYFELLFVYSVRCILLVGIQHHLLKILLFIHWIVLASFWKLTGHDFEGLLGFQFCSIDLCLSYATTSWSWLLWLFCSKFWNLQFSFLKIVLAVLDPVHFCINFRIHLSDFCKKRETKNWGFNTVFFSCRSVWRLLPC